jgi:hypothetical protein|tara:strand:+ start:8133 stop:8885 length:753 start_codon:yes stop_codon:yes gene_type:complete
MLPTVQFELFGPQERLPPRWNVIKSKNLVHNKKALPWNSRPGNKTSQTNLFIKSGVGLNKKFIHASEVKIVKALARKEGMMGTADVHPTTTLPTVNQKTASSLINFPIKAKHLFNPAQKPNVDVVEPPAKRINKNEGPTSFTTPGDDQSDIGYNDIDDPNPVEGLPPLDPIEAQGTIQPFRYDGNNLIMQSSGYKRYLKKNQEAGKSRYRKLPSGVNHDQTAMVATAVSNYIWQTQRDSANAYLDKRVRE